MAKRPPTTMRRVGRLSAEASSSDFIMMDEHCAPARRSEGSADDAGANAVTLAQTTARSAMRSMAVCFEGTEPGKFPIIWYHGRSQTVEIELTLLPPAVVCPVLAL
eukprot:543422-Rhodomonas_salina.1